LKITERAEKKFRQAEAMLQNALVPPPNAQDEDLNDVLDNPISGLYAQKHPEIVERSQEYAYVNESLYQMK